MAKIKTEHKGGSRFYVDTETKVTVPGVTSIIGMLAKPFLAPWNAKLAAEMAVDSLDFLPALVARDRDGAIDLIKGAARRYTAERSKTGSEAHDLFERQIRGEVLGPVPDRMAPYVINFAEFLRVVQPELIRAEDVAWSDTHGYAGSFDVLMKVRLDPNGKPDPAGGDEFTVIGDWKTGKSTYPEVALQMAAYQHADRVISPDGSSAPMPHIDGAMVLHITSEQWALKPVVTERWVFDYFLLLRKVFEWDREDSKRVLGKPIAGSAKRLVSGTERRGK